MAANSLFDKLNAGFNDLPIKTGHNIFITAEYAQAVGLSVPQTFRRVNQLISEGKVKKVRTRRNGRVVQGYEYVGGPR